MIKAVLFDLDGTLVNSLEDLANSTNYALSQLGFPIHKTENYKYFIGDGMQKLMERVLPENENDKADELYNIFINHYKEHYCDKTAAYNGISELLKALKKKGYKVAIISNKNHQMAIMVANKIFGNIFDCVFGKMENFPPKPDKALTVELMKRLDVDCRECVIVGDSGMDVATAKNANCYGIGVLWGYRKQDELLKNGADFIVSTPRELYDVLIRLK